MEFVKCVNNQFYESLLEKGRLYEKLPIDQEDSMIQVRDWDGGIHTLPKVLFAEPSPEDHMQEFNRIIDEIPVEEE